MDKLSSKCYVFCEQHLNPKIFQIVAATLISAVFAANLDRDAQTLRQSSDVNPDGTYSYAYETSNGIAADEQGEGGVRAQGSYKFLTPEGEVVDVSYIADENGFQPSGAVIPQPPPVPELIQRALAYIAANPPSTRK